MNPNFRFSVLTRRTLAAVVRAIAPVEIGVKDLDHYVIDQIESQVRCFPRLHRAGFVLGLTFIEWGGWIGGWGLLPFSNLSREKGTKRLYKLLRSSITPVSLLVNGLRVLVCLSAYGHSEVEQWFGFERRRWRAQRIKTRQRLMSSMYGNEIDEETKASAPQIPPPPEALYRPVDEERAALLSWESHDQVKSPFSIEDISQAQILTINSDRADSVPEKVHNVL